MSHQRKEHFLKNILIRDDNDISLYHQLNDVNLKIEDISSIEIGTPGAVDSAKGIVVFANNLGFKNVELGKMLEEKLGKKVYCENDANVAAYGEYLVDDENEGDTLVAITIGTGIGVERADFFSNHNIQNNK